MMVCVENVSREIETEGFAIAENVLPVGTVNQLIAWLSEMAASSSIRSRGGVFAVRNLLDVSPESRDLADSTAVRALVAPVLGDRFFPVRGTLFDKIPTANWKVPWHQDVTIAVQEKLAVEGFGPWSTKAEVLHVQPPASILENMLTVRLHLDACGEANGALRVIPGSHRHAKIPEADIDRYRQSTPEQVCAVGVGGALVMRPLLLHASSPSSIPGHRRVIHFDFASVQLPGGLRWFSEAVTAGKEIH